MIPVQPTFLDRPFCANGNKNSIPTTNNGTEGYASLSLGFPPITEQPISTGGVPPFRKDFNGVLNWLSAFAFWAQSGGVFTYSATANYTTPAIVMYNNVLYFCKNENGIDSTNGVKTPGTDTSYWVRLIDYILDQATKSVGTPIGTIIMWASSNNPSDGGVWLDCNGQSCTAYPALVSVLGANTVPDLRGLFPRCVGDQDLSVTINGTTSTQTFSGGSVGTKQADATRNITGTLRALDDYSGIGTSGAFYQTGSSNKGYDSHDQNANFHGVGFNASRVVPTATENRPASVALRFLIKAE